MRSPASLADPGGTLETKPLADLRPAAEIEAPLSGLIGIATPFAATAACLPSRR